MKSFLSKDDSQLTDNIQLKFASMAEHKIFITRNTCPFLLSDQKFFINQMNLLL